MNQITKFGHRKDEKISVATDEDPVAPSKIALKYKILRATDSSFN